METRGLRNNNPLNIRKSAAKWKGEVQPSIDPAFKQFRTMAYGYRAAIVTLRTYQRKYHLRSITEMINRWAPDSENNTKAYIDTVSKRTGIPSGFPVNMDDGHVACQIVAAMSYVENGVAAKMQDVVAGFNLLKL